MATAKKKPRKVTRYRAERSVVTVFYSDFQARRSVRQNRACYPFNAALNAHRHLRWQTYPEAVLAEVFDEITGVVYAVVKRDVRGNIHTLYEDKALELDEKYQQGKET